MEKVIDTQGLPWTRKNLKDLSIMVWCSGSLKEKFLQRSMSMGVHHVGDWKAGVETGSVSPSLISSHPGWFPRHASNDPSHH